MLVGLIGDEKRKRREGERGERVIHIYCRIIRSDLSFNLNGGHLLAVIDEPQLPCSVLACSTVDLAFAERKRVCCHRDCTEPG